MICRICSAPHSCNDRDKFKNAFTRKSGHAALYTWPRTSRRTLALLNATFKAHATQEPDFQ
eukprot:5484456-Pyramimonas_sp.AAC.1